MNPKQFKNHLGQIAEDGAPANIDLWPRIEGQINTMPSRQTKNPSLPKLGYAVAALSILVMMVAMTPQGRALAVDLLSFFTAARNGQISLPVNHEYPPMSEMQTLKEAEAALGWDIKEFAESPSGLSFSRVEINLEEQFVRTHYEVEGGRLVLSQTLSDYLFDGDWESVPIEAVEPVMIGNVSGEYVQGGFVAVNPEVPEATWNPNLAMQRLRWKQGDFWFEILKQGDSDPIEHLDKTAIIALAENLK